MAKDKQKQSTIKESEFESTDEKSSETRPNPEKESVREPEISLAELISMRRIPDHHAFALGQYVGKDKVERKLSEWDSLYKEMMSKPTDMPKEQWHEKFKNQKVR